MGEGKKKKNIISPYFESNQSMKLSREIGFISISTVNQDYKLHINFFFNLLIDNSSLSNANMFVSFHTAQNIHKEAAHQVFLQVLPTKNPYYLRRISFTEQLKT